MLDERTLYGWLLLGMVALAAVIVVVLLFITAPYGRHGGETWGPKLSARLGWVLMESPAALVFGGLLVTSRLDGPRLAFLLLWESHYLYRAFVYPFRLRPGSRMPAHVMLLGMLFCALNGYLNGRWLSHLGPTYPAGWLADPRFIVGASLFLVGLAINHHADWVLRTLRRPGETGYKIPRGGLYRFVSCPNYLGEIVEWCGWAVATWSLPGLAFAIWTVANLLPRARSHHRWYREQFSEYPLERKALIPFLL